jgi:hypothetical protein
MAAKKALHGRTTDHCMWYVVRDFDLRGTPARAVGIYEQICSAQR